ARALSPSARPVVADGGSRQEGSARDVHAATAVPTTTCSSSAAARRPVHPAAGRPGRWLPPPAPVGGRVRARRRACRQGDRSPGGDADGYPVRIGDDGTADDGGGRPTSG